MYEIIFDVISAWQVIVVGLIIIIILPVIFYFASFDKTPVKIKRVPDKRRAREEEIPAAGVKSKHRQEDTGIDESADER